MKKLLAIFGLLLLMTSCQSLIVTPQQPMRTNSLDLYTSYRIQTSDAKTMKVKVLKQDNEKIYGKLRSGEDVVINKADVRTVRKTDVLTSLLVAAAAVAAVVFIPM